MITNDIVSFEQLGPGCFAFLWSVASVLRSNFNGSNIFKTMEICSRYGQFEPLRVNHDVRFGSNWRLFGDFFPIF